jgi:hypothetical protein
MSSEIKQDQIQESPKQDQKDLNFDKLRKQLEQERQLRLQAEDRAKQLELSQKQGASQSEDQEDEYDEPYVDTKRLNKKLNQFGQKVNQNTADLVQNEVQKALSAEREANFLKTNSDFNEILKEENILKLAERHPEVAEGLTKLPKGFEQQKAVYHQIKALNLHKKEEPKESIQDTVNKNQRNPYYFQPTTGNPPYAGQSDFSKTGQESAYKKMQELKSRLRI